MLSRILYVFAIIALMLAGQAVIADGLLLPVEEPHSGRVVPNELFTVKYHYVDVNIDDQVCSTKVDQTFHNDSDIDREGMYIFPMPEGSAISKFSLYSGEKEITGKILGKSEARSIYESIVSQRKDPALLEYIDRNTFKASVYPIPAHGDKRIKISYSEILEKTGNTCRYVYPLSTERFSAKPLEDCRVKVKIHSKYLITNIYSPTHNINVTRTNDHEAVVSWQSKGTRPDTDMILYYTLTRDDLGIDLLTHKEEGKDGYFLILASPRVEMDKRKVLPKNVVFVLDRTGSMSGEKIEQAKDALKFCINSLKNEDRFNVINFNESANPVFDSLQASTSIHKQKAISAIDDIVATGGTDINTALKAALKQFGKSNQSRNYIVFLTDGVPTSGITDPKTILGNISSANNKKAKIFAFGVGYDVNTHLLDQLSQQNKGDADYVRPKENIETKVSSFFAKVSDPILTDVQVSISGAKTFDLYPSKDIPDIFKGSQLVILGRYSAPGKVKITVSGSANSTRKTYAINETLPAAKQDCQFIPQLWASRKIGYLLDEIRLKNNSELVNEVVRLSKEFGIPTEYTSFLADDRNLTADISNSMPAAALKMSDGHAVNTGTYGVSQSTNNRSLKSQAQAAAPVKADNAITVGKMAANQRIGGTYYDSNDQQVVVANVQNIEHKTFYQRGDYWEDANLKENQQFIKIKQFSDAHFKLLKAYPKLSQYSTLGNVRLVLENNQGIEIGPEGKDNMTDDEVKSIFNGVPAKGKVTGSIFSRSLPAGIAAACILCVPLAFKRKRQG